MPDIMNAILPPDVGKPVTGSTQEHLPIKAIHDDVVILKDGTCGLVLKTSAVNFDLLSENEQLAIISSFAQLLNSLSFSIQIVVRSKRLDISNYIETLKKVEAAQTNPLLRDMTRRYRVFVETLTSENEVLDKQFYLVISVSYIEIGLTNQIEKDLKKAVTILVPRRDHIIKQLARIGLKATQLNTEKLIQLYHDFYNETTTEQDIRAFIDKELSLKNPVANNNPAPAQTPQAKVPEVRIVDSDINPPKPNLPPLNNQVYLQNRTSEEEEKEVRPTTGNLQPPAKPARASTPFVVEELDDDYGQGAEKT
jgi:hypothetical protein